MPAGAEPRRLLWMASAMLLALPAALAFFSGGFFDEPRLISAVGVWLLLAVTVLCGIRSLPTEWPGRVAVCGLALLSALALASLAWAPLAGRVLDDAQRDLLYLGALVLAIAVLRSRSRARLAEPALALGIALVVAYALSGRLLPGIIDQEETRQALGRLDQPVTYWNALGALAALGLVLCARMAGDEERRPATRELAAAAAVLLGAALYLTFSRGALAAAAAGLTALVVLAPLRPALRAAALAAGAAVVGTLAVAFFPEVTTAAAGAGGFQGAAALALLVGAGLVVGLLQRIDIRRGSAAGTPAPARLVRPARIAAALLAVAVLSVTAVATLGGERALRDEAAIGADPRRLGSVESQRYDYWRVAHSAFAERPLLGQGAGSFKVEWRRSRPLGSAPASDAHSLYFETAAELGLAGLVCVAMLFAGVIAAGRRALARDRALTAGPLAALAAWALHAGLDWDWEMPALTLVAVLLAGVVLAVHEEEIGPSSAEQANRLRPKAVNGTAVPE